MLSRTTRTTRGPSLRHSAPRLPTGSCAVALSDSKGAASSGAASNGAASGGAAVTELQIINPATEEVTATVRAASAADADAAVARASAAWPGWRQIAPADRAALLRAFAATVDEHIGELAEL